MPNFRPLTEREKFQIASKARKEYWQRKRDEETRLREIYGPE